MAIFITIFCLLTLAYGTHTEPEIKYANYIFNEIVSSARQFGSSLNHNGMAFFIATVPIGLELYHGSGSKARVEKLDWLAFEPEHALVFARPGSNRVPRPSEHCDGRDTKLYGQEVPRPKSDRSYAPAGDDAVTNGTGDPSYGYLHTYRTRSDLRLLYLDGSSAAKSDRGTLDLQDIILLQHNPLDICHLAAAPEHQEDHERAAKMCELASTEWQGRINGFLRMEAGFEIILCDFAKDLDPVRITQTRPMAAPPGLIVDGHAYFKAIARRHDGIGGGRIKLDYEHHVSLFAYPDAIYFDNAGRARVNSESSIIPVVRQAVREMALSQEPIPTMNVDWQSAADMIVARYSDTIIHLISVSSQLPASFSVEAERSLRPFIDYGTRDKSAEIERCQKYGIPWQGWQSQSTAARAVREVSRVICSTLWSLAHSEVNSFARDVSMIRALRKFLAWTEWKKCKGCAPNEFCFVPIWPIGAAEDFEKPRCISDLRTVGRHYWRRVERRRGGLAACTGNETITELYDYASDSCPSDSFSGHNTKHPTCDISDIHQVQAESLDSGLTTA